MPTPDDRRASYTRPGAAYCRLQGHTRFINENEGSSLTLSLFFKRPSVRSPSLDGCLVTLQGLPFGLLATESQIVHQPPNLRLLITNDELLEQQLSDERKRPEWLREALLLGPFSNTKPI